MTQTMYQPEERERVRRKLNEQAIDAALKSQWEDAVELNQRLLGLIPQDLSTLNRLGKALSELGRYAEARKAYGDALELDPTNNIARKNYDRLAPLAETDTAGPVAHERIDPRLFIEETGKTGFTNLIDLAPRDVLARLTAGDQVYLDREGAIVYVKNANGDRIGRVEPRLAARLIKFMEGGNKYAAGIADLGDRVVRIIIRETYQAPDMFGKVSFPAQGGEVTRGYIKDTMLRYELEEEEGEEDEYTADEEEEAEEGAEQEFEEPEFREPEE
ncbi:MAG TPA: tetratricopeptide repeat protein [Ktedonobacterales bacterium]|nr:tetratricopeptide repeat protein [Ktedonobacterales bacterium]